MSVRWTFQAARELDALLDHLAERNVAAAEKLGGRILAVIDQLASRGFAGPEIRLLDGDVVRTWAVPPVRIYYQWVLDDFWVLRIYHQARSPIAR